MFRWVNSSPVLFAQSLEIKNRQRFRRFKGIAKKMSNLLSDRSVLVLRASLELPVERVGKVFYVQNCHKVTPKLHNRGIISDVSRLLLAPKNFHKELRSVTPGGPRPSDGLDHHFLAGQAAPVNSPRICILSTVNRRELIPI